MDQLSNNINKNIPDQQVPPNDEIKVTMASPTGGDVDPAEMMRAASGLNISQDQLAALDHVEVSQSLPAGDVASGEAFPGSDPGINLEPVHVPGAGSKFDIVGEDEAREMGIAGEGTSIDITTEAIQRDAEKFKQIQKEKQNDMISGLEEMLKSENERIERMENTLQDPEKAQEMLGDDNKIVRSTISKGEADKNVDRFSNLEDELLPSYDDNEAEDEAPEADKKDPTPDDDDAYAELIRDLEVATVNTGDTAIQTVKDRNIEIVQVGAYKKAQNLNDQAFMNAVTKFKKDNFGKVSVPLPNSGFYVDMVGTGVVDLQNLYLNVDNNMDKYDYQLERMHTVIRNVTGTKPHVDSRALSGMIHFEDYQMMAFGHMCATLKTVETVTNCQHCGKPFRISSRTNELLLNMTEIIERARAIDAANSIDQVSLMTHYHTVTTPNGIVITLGHPSYQEIIRCIRTYQSKVEDMPAVEARRFEGMLPTLYMIRKIHLPTNVDATNIYQIYLAFKLLTDDDSNAVADEIAKMGKNVVIPQFGVRAVTCPHCKQVNKDIKYDGISDLLFYHTMVSGYLKKTEG